MSERDWIGTGINRRGRGIELSTTIGGKLYTKMTKSSGKAMLRREREMWIEEIERAAKTAERTGIGAEFVGVTLRQVFDELVRRGLMFRNEKGVYSFDEADTAGYGCPLARLLECYSDRPIVDLTAPLCNDFIQQRLLLGAGGRKHGTCNNTINKSFIALRKAVRFATIGDAKSRDRKPILSYEDAAKIAPIGALHYPDSVKTDNNSDGIDIDLVIRRLIENKALERAASDPLFYSAVQACETGQRTGEILLQRVELIDFKSKQILVRPQDQKSAYWKRICLKRKDALPYRRVILFDGLRTYLIKCAIAHGYKVEYKDGVPRIIGTGYLFGTAGAAAASDKKQMASRMTGIFDIFFKKEIMPELSAMAARGEIEQIYVKRYRMKDIRVSVENDLKEQWRIHNRSMKRLMEHMGHTEAVSKENYDRDDGSNYDAEAALSPFVTERPVALILDRNLTSNNDIQVRQ